MKSGRRHDRAKTVQPEYPFVQASRTLILSGIPDGTTDVEIIDLLSKDVNPIHFQFIPRKNDQCLAILEFCSDADASIVLRRNPFIMIRGVRILLKPVNHDLKLGEPEKEEEKTQTASASHVFGLNQRGIRPKNLRNVDALVNQGGSRSKVVRSLVEPKDSADLLAGVLQCVPDPTSDVILRILRVVKEMPRRHLVLIMQDFQAMLVEDSALAKQWLHENPQMIYALLHASFILGLIMEPHCPISVEELKILRERAEINRQAIFKSQEERTKPPPEPPTHRRFDS